MNIAFPTKAFLPAKTRLFIDFLVEDFRHTTTSGFGRCRAVLRRLLERRVSCAIVVS